MRCRRQRPRRIGGANPEAASQNQWTANPLISELVHRRMSGGESSGYWLAWLMADYFKGRRFARVLSPGCGVGDCEIALMSSGKIDRLDAFDLSEASIRIAGEKAAAWKFNIHFYTDDIDAFEVPEGVRYDMIFCSGAVHHVREIERFFRVVRGALGPDGVFVFNEYVGPCYNIYPREQLEIVNRLLRAIAPGFRRAHELGQNTVDGAMAHDPSESVRWRSLTRPGGIDRNGLFGRQGPGYCPGDAGCSLHRDQAFEVSVSAPPRFRSLGVKAVAVSRTRSPGIVISLRAPVP